MCLGFTTQFDHSDHSIDILLEKSIVSFKRNIKIGILFKKKICTVRKYKRNNIGIVCSLINVGDVCDDLPSYPSISFLRSISSRR